MDQYPFIFSNKRNYRLQRHFAFWIFWLFFLASIYVFSPVPSYIPWSQRIGNSIIDSSIYLPCHIFLSYSLMYVVIPRYVEQSKYKTAALWTITLFFTTAAMSALITMYFLTPIKSFLLPNDYIIRPMPQKQIDNAKFHLALIAGLRGSITIGGMAAAIKLMKHWYMKEKLALALRKENVESQLQLLKAQVHPHFLFNTLNNIYSTTQNTAPAASEMILGLSDILRYMLYECDKPLVPLSQELKMIDEYMNLEKIRYGNKLELHIDIPDDTKGLMIAPLILLPFVENCFKHGTSHMLHQPWINLTITLNENEMTMKLMNSKTASLSSKGKGIGIANVQQRLALSYADKHSLTIKEEDDVYIVNLKLQLAKVRVQVINTSTSVPVAANY